MSVFVNIGAGITIYQLFGKLQFSRVFPLGGITEQKAIHKSGKIAFYGDSRALAWAASTASEGQAVSRAVGGQTSTQLLLQLKQMASQPQRTAVVQIGINDLHSLGAFPEYTELALEQLKSNLISICNILRAQSDVVIVTTIFPPSDVPISRRLFWLPSTNELIKEINAFILQLDDGTKVQVLDSFKLLADGTGRLQPRFKSDDGFFLHVNASAYEVLDNALHNQP
jgi:lysophospholipase L1-like esterase